MLNQVQLIIESRSKEKISQSRDNWNKGNFHQVPGDIEIIMAPQNKIK